MPNTGHGINLQNATARVEGNVISGNGASGINAKVPASAAAFNQIADNYIGTDFSGGADLGNAADGITLEFGSTVSIQAASRIWSNVVSGNNGNGIRAFSTTNQNRPLTPEGGGSFLIDLARRPGGSNASSPNVPPGNMIGTNAAGTSALGNAGHGVSISGVKTKIGGDTSAEGNVIAHNGGSGVNIANIGDQTVRTGNLILGNLIMLNGLQGIDLGGDGPTQNDTGDGDTGANNLQNYPVLASATSGPAGTTVSGTISTTPNTDLKIEFHVSSDVRLEYPAGPYGLTSLRTNASGNASFNVTFPVTVPAGRFVAATATTSDSNPNNENNTSEISPAVAVIPSVVTVSISGRVATPQGNSLRNATVTLIRENGETRTALSSSFGLYAFDTVPAGETYIVRVGSKRYRFAAQSVAVGSSNLTVDFTGIE
jgi:hypothetical protein